MTTPLAEQIGPVAPTPTPAGTATADPPTPVLLQPAVEPSYAPFFLALGTTMFFWGIVTSIVMSAGGAALIVWALWMWISQIANSWRNAHARGTEAHDG